jgi:hypothetical protein
VPLVDLLSTPWTRPPYLAPVFAAMVLLFVAGMRRLERSAAGLLFVRVTLVSVVAAFLFSAPLLARQWRIKEAQKRADIERQLGAIDGKHIILVRYGPRHLSRYEFVHNAADLDDAKVIWARSIDAARDARLLEHYAHRSPWLLIFDDPDFAFGPMRR